MPKQDQLKKNNNHHQLDSSSEKPKPSFKILIYVGAVLALFAISAQLIITLTTFHDPRTDLLHKHIRAFNITSSFSSPGAAKQSSSSTMSSSATETVALVAGHEFGNEHNKDGAVLGVTKHFRKGDVILSFPFDTFVDPNAKGTFVEALMKFPKWSEQGRNYPVSIFGLSTWVLVEQQKKKQKKSRWGDWLEAIEKSDNNNNKDANDINGKGAFHWNSEKASACVSDFFSRDLEQTLALIPKLEEAINLVCEDEEMVADFGEDYTNFICTGAPRFSNDDLRSALDVVNRRSIMNQALVPLFDFHEVSIQQNVGLRVNSKDKELHVIALQKMEPGTPLRFQRFLGRIDAFMRTGYHFHTLGLEAISGSALMVGGDNEQSRKICLERAGQMVFNERGEQSGALQECIGLMTLVSPVTDRMNVDVPQEDAMRERKLPTKSLRKMKARFLKNPALELQKNKELQSWVIGNLTAGVEEKLRQLKQGEEALVNEPYCRNFEKFRKEVIQIYEKAIHKMHGH